jgi:hypothetical protein
LEESEFFVVLVVLAVDFAVEAVSFWMSVVAALVDTLEMLLMLSS